MGIAMPIVTNVEHPRRLADYSADYRMLILAAMAIVAGTGGRSAPGRFSS